LFHHYYLIFDKEICLSLPEKGREEEKERRTERKRERERERERILHLFLSDNLYEYLVNVFI